MAKLADLDTTRSKLRIGVQADDKGVVLYLDTPNGFWKAPLTHSEARWLAFRLMGSSDPYADAKEG